jgi:hypothetical protein
MDRALVRTRGALARPSRGAVFDRSNNRGASGRSGEQRPFDRSSWRKWS